MLIYDTGDIRQPPCAPFVKNASAMFSFSQGCLCWRQEVPADIWCFVVAPPHAWAPRSSRRSTAFNGTNKIRAYAHCAKNSEEIALLLINLDGISTNRIYVTSQGAHARSGRKKESRTSDVHIIPAGLGEAAAALTRQEYHLTPKDGNLQSQQLLLNGNVLATDADGEIPELEPVQVEGTQPITVGPYSIVFAHVPSFYAPACL
ncbi:uncharacterized protein [Zea mays]|uniref:uncharacterized protein isoform X3 n=1 Tax=Zea mays TaxID=4577 RepID=UPI00022217BC|nr:uncharacterized protein LOC100217207 isoform X3 [Zea mays]XP_035823660.1 uncharacterized protein LOC100217207 isoform X3 [Zea mays]XP_035823661.1 uncharacterized protein LOC100217207 isoform X3 [Zea mays]XP_035823662.1 uncharacterized protein LOC100217207 isoform X3 [Zea mays]|eukprot:XP_008681323.1 uncharacterized protein LOC100217207 isoform X3 [Zea mays]